MSIKNPWILRCVSRLRPRRDNASDAKRFLILSTTGIGDTLWATPALRALRESFPSSYIGVLTSALGAQLLQHNSRIDEVFALRHNLLLDSLSLYRKLKAKQISHVLCFHTSQRYILPLVSLIGARHYIGSYGMNKGLDSLLTQAINNLNLHEIQRRLDLVAQVDAHTLDVSMELPLGPEEEREADRVLEQLSLSASTPLVGLHPGSRDLFKRWPAPHFIALGKRIAAATESRILVTGNAQEQNLAQTIASQIPGARPITHLSLLGMGALLKRLRLFVTNDTGSMHLACANQVPTIGLFTPTRPELCGPYACPSALSISRKPTCTPCLKKQCKEPFCLLQIGVEEVYAAVLQQLYAPKEV